MSKSAMLRTRRRDVNVKPNRRLDRKSSRGMIYENEELRLRTININAEIERGQSDIKKLRRENEQLRKEIWCLRDEYEKLDKLLKEKNANASCSSCSSDTDSCTSCTESENETTQNLENVQKTTLKNLRTEFDHLSVVTEETSAENSEKNSVANPQECTWDAIAPDQSYPKSVLEETPKHFFAPLKPPTSFNGCHNSNLCTASQPWMSFVNYDQNLSKATPLTQKPFVPTLPFDSNVPKVNLQTCKKTTPDILVKTDFPNFSQESTTSSFVNGGNLEELLQDIETISQDILQISAKNAESAQKTDKTFEQMVEEPEENNIETIKRNQIERPFKSELNVVLMPKAMPLLGFDKYQNIKTSLESVATFKKSTESLSMMDIPNPDINIPLSFTPQPFPTEFINFTPDATIPTVPAPIPPIAPIAPIPELTRQISNPFFYGAFDNFQNTETFPNRQNIDKFPDNFGFKSDVLLQNSNKVEEKEDKTNIKTNIENEIVENKSGAVKPEKEKIENEKNDCKNVNKKEEGHKSPKLRKTRKVSIYFKGKKDKLARSFSLDTTKPLPEDRKLNSSNQKTSSTESKVSLFEGASPKTAECDKIINSDNKTSSDSKNSNYDRKHRKSSSTSPERKHIHGKHESEKKCHKKRHKKSDKRPINRTHSTASDRLRERSYSVCTDRSNILEHKFGHFDDYTNSERDRSNSLSSCDTVKSRKMSALPNIPVSGKIPWFGCWGNGCL